MILLSSVLITVLAIGWNLVGAGVILIWSGGLSALMFGLLKRFDILRLRPEVEESVSQEFTILSARIYENASLLTTFKVNVSKEKIVYTKYSLASEKVSFTYVCRRMPIDKHVKARLIVDRFYRERTTFKKNRLNAKSVCGPLFQRSATNHLKKRHIFL